MLHDHNLKWWFDYLYNRVPSVGRQGCSVVGINHNSMEDYSIESLDVQYSFHAICSSEFRSADQPFCNFSFRDTTRKDQYYQDCYRLFHSSIFLGPQQATVRIIIHNSTMNTAPFGPAVIVCSSKGLIRCLSPRT